MLTHLFTLFWTWDNTVAKIIHWGLFVGDMCAEIHPPIDVQEPPRHQFCSEFLINAMLAVATIYDVERTSSPNSATQGRLFADEALRLLETKQHLPTLPYLQGIAILWAYEETLGNATTAAALLAKLFELHATCRFFQPDPRLYQVEAANKATRIHKATALIAWGFYGLDAKISFTYSCSMRIKKPMFPKPYRGDETSNTGFDSLNDLWFPYPVSIQPRLSYHKEAIDAECEFAEFAEQALLIIEEARTSPVPDYVKTKSIYNRLITRKSALLGRFTDNGNSLPAKVFLQISFDMLAIKLLEPFTRLSFLEFDGGQTSQSLSFLHSDSIISALWNYRTAFGMRHEYWMIHACQIAAMALLPHLSGATTQAEIFQRACELLHDMGKHLPLANCVLSTLKAVIAREGIEMPSGVSRFIAMAGKADRVHIKNICLDSDKARMMRARYTGQKGVNHQCLLRSIPYTDYLSTET
ncbi:putative fungal-specific transcription factor [Dactylonectria macrodidyma]|uniref:Fungal-specific transcription factor n=1 Tax=Dactylonectria macrodidyma TaxID=307937 RepID=A0A9P9EDY1_9HYPO|nr:putative fungal-specific transcription factor [Dactylonectria macrodidyma]